MKKNLLLVNATDEKNLPKVVAAKQFGLQISLVGMEFPEWIKPYVDHFIKTDGNINTTLEKLTEFNKAHPIHGVITFWDREVENVAMIAQHFNLPGNFPEAARKAKNKLQMRQTLADAHIPQAKFCPVKTLEDLKAAATQLSFPFIFKPVAASASAAVFKIEDEANLDSIFKTMESLPRSAYWLYPYDYIAEEFLIGNELSVEGIINQNKIYIAGITQKWATADAFVEWQHCFPARLDEKTQNAIIDYTKACIHAIGLNNTAFHAELKIIDDQIKMIEVNARMGGDFITSNLLPLTGIDIATLSIKTALGETIDMPEPDGYACVRFLLSDKAGKILSYQIPDHLLKNSRIQSFGLLKQVGEEVTLPPLKFAENRLCYVISYAKDYDEVIQNSERALQEIQYKLG